jgi:hypothetical protein
VLIALAFWQSDLVDVEETCLALFVNFVIGAPFVALDINRKANMGLPWSRI